MKRKKVTAITALILALTAGTVFTGCQNSSASSESSNADTNKLKVTVSFDAMYEFTKAVGKAKVDITTIIPTGTEPHDFELKASDIANLCDADVFIYNGLGMESWAEKAVSAASNNKLVTVVASTGAEPIKNTSAETADGQSPYDPHLWLSLTGAETEVQNIADGLSKADPTNKVYYESNAASYIKQLDRVYQSYKAKFSKLSQKDFVTGHAAFSYFCKDFGLEQKSVEGVFAEGEPSTKQLALLADYCKKEKVSTIFAEKMVNPEVSETLANEVGAKVETIYTIEGAEDHLDYLSRIKSNCKKIYQSLAIE